VLGRQVLVVELLALVVGALHDLVELAAVQNLTLTHG
jgi:hypothetical protein